VLLRAGARAARHRFGSGRDARSARAEASAAAVAAAAEDSHNPQGTVHWVETTMVRQQLAPERQSMARTIAAVARAEGPLALYRGFAAAGPRPRGHHETLIPRRPPLSKSARLQVCAS